jgi:Skp family chaperone for outer membrane proteins
MHNIIFKLQKMHSTLLKVIAIVSVNVKYLNYRVHTLTEKWETMQKYKNEELTRWKKKLVNKVAKEMNETQRQIIESRSKNLGKKCQQLGNNTHHTILCHSHTQIHPHHAYSFVSLPLRKRSHRLTTTNL